MNKKKTIIKLGFDGKHKEDDFLLLPVPAIGFYMSVEGWGIGIGIKFGFWAVFLAIYRVTDNSYIIHQLMRGYMYKTYNKRTKITLYYRYWENRFQSQCVPPGCKRGTLTWFTHGNGVELLAKIKKEEEDG